MKNQSQRPSRFGSILIVLSAITAVLSITPIANAATLQWDRNPEADMKDYQVYACFSKGCTVTKTPAMLQPNPVVQPATGTVPSYVIDLTGKEGALAITARDNSLNESGLSVPFPFDLRPPAIPGNLRLP